MNEEEEYQNIYPTPEDTYLYKDGRNSIKIIPYNIGELEEEQYKKETGKKAIYFGKMTNDFFEWSKSKIINGIIGKAKENPNTMFVHTKKDGVVYYNSDLEKKKEEKEIIMKTSNLKYWLSNKNELK